MCCYVEYELFWDIGIFLSPPSAVFLLLSVAGHAGGPSERWGQVCALTKVRGTCSGGSKSRTLANNHGIAFRPARANQAHANPKKTIFPPHANFSFVRSPPYVISSLFANLYCRTLLTMCQALERIRQARGAIVLLVVNHFNYFHLSDWLLLFFTCINNSSHQKG